MKVFCRDLVGLSYFVAADWSIGTVNALYDPTPAGALWNSISKLTMEDQPGFSQPQVCPCQ